MQANPRSETSWLDFAYPHALPAGLLKMYT